jgi:hypothetical protein
MTAAAEAKLAGIHFAIEGLQNRLDGDITDSAERKAYEREVSRLVAQMHKINAKAGA